jgi:hypothetical protein
LKETLELITKILELVKQSSLPWEQKRTALEAARTISKDEADVIAA